MSLNKDATRVERFTHACKNLFWPMDEGDVQEGIGNSHMDDERDTNGFTRGGPEGEGNNNPDELKPGKRTNRWFERIEDVTEENRRRSTENKNYLSRLDYRTVWIMRLLVAIAATVAGGIILQLLIA